MNPLLQRLFDKWKAGDVVPRPRAPIRRTSSRSSEFVEAYLRDYRALVD